jgi:predicted methyltransferase
MMTRRLAIALSTGLLLAGGATMTARAADDAALKAAVASPDRGAPNVARDGSRHPVESLTFWGLKPGLTVIEVSPGGGYWTEILAPYAKATGGTYVATAADLNNPKISDAARKSRADFEAKFSDAGKYGAVQYVGFGPVSAPLRSARPARRTSSSPPATSTTSCTRAICCPSRWATSSRS